MLKLKILENDHTFLNSVSQDKMKVYVDILSGDEMLSDAFASKDVIDKEGNKVNRKMTL